MAEQQHQHGQHQEQKQKQEKAPDRSPEAKKAAIDQLAADMTATGESFHFDTAYALLRGNPAFDANDPEERVFVSQNWATAIQKAAEAKAKKEEKKQ